jgi:DNA-binding beta-propeller fold protein YncE
MAVDSEGNFYVSDYYRHNVDVWDGDADYVTVTETASGELIVPGRRGYLGQLTGVDPLDGPCGLALNASDDLYVNDYHRGVIGFGAFPSFSSGTAFPLPAEDPAHHLPTGVAVDPASGLVYVDNRTYVAVHEADGTPLVEGSEQVRIGLGSLEDGYGIAFSQYPGTAGYLYVPDAASNTIKIYDPQTSAAAPVAEIDGSTTPPGHFVSLRDAAIAVDRVTGNVYVVDNLQPYYTEQPEAVVYVFGAAGEYLGHLKYRVDDALPVGLAVDNSARATQGRVYVTSGNTELAAIYAYPPGAATTAPAQPASYGLNVSSSDSGNAVVTSSSGPGACAEICESVVAPGMPRIQTPAAAAAIPRRADRHRRRHHHPHHRRGGRRQPPARGGTRAQ